MRIVFIETDRLTNEIIRAVAGAAPNCVGYPDGVPESWRDVAPVKQGGDLMPDLPMKHFMDETAARLGDLEYNASSLVEHVDDLESAARRSAAETKRIQGETRAALAVVEHLFPHGCPTCGYPDESGLTHYADADAGDGVYFANYGALLAAARRAAGGAGGGLALPDHELDPAALLGPVVEPVGWPDERGDDEC